MLLRVNDGASVLWTAAYDGDGVRRKRVDAKGTIHYLGGYERNVGNGQFSRPLKEYPICGIMGQR